MHSSCCYWFSFENVPTLPPTTTCGVYFFTCRPFVKSQNNLKSFSMACLMYRKKIHLNPIIISAFWSRAPFSHTLMIRQSFLNHFLKFSVRVLQLLRISYQQTGEVSIQFMFGGTAVVLLHSTGVQLITVGTVFCHFSCQKLKGMKFRHLLYNKLIGSSRAPRLS